MKRIASSVVAVSLFIMGCDTTSTSAPTGLSTVGGLASNRSGIVHRVSAGGADFVGAGVDANYSLVAFQYADGSVKGQWSDQFGHGNGGFHAEVTCLHVEGNEAWVTGIETSGEFKGRQWITRLKDNGTSSKDAPDEISFSWVDLPGAPPDDCHFMPPLELFPREKGQVTID